MSSDPTPGSSRSTASAVDVSKLPRGAISMRGLPIGRNARLPSIRGPRDLTLISAPKRTFVPNIPARREKKSVQDAEQKSSKTDSRSRSSPNMRGGRGRGRGHREYVQMPGIVFGDGVTAAPKPTSSGGSIDVRPQRPVIKKEAKQNSNVSVEFVKLEPKSDSDSNAEDDPDYNEEEGSDYETPVCLPLKVDLEAIKEPQKTNKGGWNHDFFTNAKKTAVVKGPKTLKELLFDDTYNNNLIFFELPDTILLPLQNKELSDTQQRPASGASNEDKSSSSEDTPTWDKCIEGLIGKLQLMKSGRTRLVIGDYVLDDVEMIDSSPVLQQLVSVHSSANELDMSVIGQLHHKVRFMPNIENLANMVLS